MLLTVAFGCTSNTAEQRDYHLAFPSVAQADGTNSGGKPLTISICEFSGPHDTQVLARVSGEPVHVSYPRDCDVEPEYVRDHRSVEMDVLAASSNAVGDTIEPFWVAGSGYGGTAYPSMGEGQTFVLSLREANGEWIVTQYAEVAASTERVPNPNFQDVRWLEFELPDRWSSVLAAVSNARSDYAADCVDKLHDSYWTDNFTMSDAEFERLVTTPTERSWCSPDSVDPPDVGLTD